MPDVVTSRWANVSQERSQHLVKCAAGQWKHFCEISPPGCLFTKIEKYIYI